MGDPTLGEAGAGRGAVVGRTRDGARWTKALFNRF